jgi:hypothetical protein
MGKIDEQIEMLTPAVRDSVSHALGSGESESAMLQETMKGCN